MNNFEIKKFLLKHKKDFQKYLDKNILGLCIFCPMFKDTKEEIHYENTNCSKVYKHIALSLGKAVGGLVHSALDELDLATSQ